MFFGAHPEHDRSQNFQLTFTSERSRSSHYIWRSSCDRSNRNGTLERSRTFAAERLLTNVGWSFVHWSLLIVDLALTPSPIPLLTTPFLLKAYIRSMQYVGGYSCMPICSRACSPTSPPPQKNGRKNVRNAKMTCSVSRHQLLTFDNEHAIGYYDRITMRNVLQTHPARIAYALGDLL